MIDLLLLGTGGMQPLPYRWLSSLLLRCEGELVLFDCGEGTQIPWKRFGWGFRRLSAICLSHVHADHVAGLPGLFHTVAIAGRSEPIDVHGPVGVAAVVAGLRVIAPWLPYEIRVHEWVGGDRFDLPAGMVGSVVEGRHGVPSLAYRVDLARARRFDPAKAAQHGIPQVVWGALQRGEDVTWAGGTATPDDVLGPPRRGLRMGFLTDTTYLPNFADHFRDVDLLVSEGTYGDPEDAEKAKGHNHMTFAQAATIARDAGARRLWLTHFSARMDDPAEYLPHATAIFPATEVGFSGLTTRLDFDDGETTLGLGHAGPSAPRSG